MMLCAAPTSEAIDCAPLSLYKKLRAAGVSEGRFYNHIKGCDLKCRCYILPHLGETEFMGSRACVQSNGYYLPIITST